MPPPLTSKDEEHLNLLATFHYVLGALGALFACFPLIHGVFTIIVLSRGSVQRLYEEAPNPSLEPTPTPLTGGRSSSRASGDRG